MNILFIPSFLPIRVGKRVFVEDSSWKYIVKRKYGNRGGFDILESFKVSHEEACGFRAHVLIARIRGGVVEYQPVPFVNGVEIQFALRRTSSSQ